MHGYEYGGRPPLPHPPPPNGDLLPPYPQPGEPLYMDPEGPSNSTDGGYTLTSLDTSNES